MGPKLYFSTRRWECFLKRKLSSRILLPDSVPWILDSGDIKRQYMKYFSSEADAMWDHCVYIPQKPKSAGCYVRPLCLLHSTEAQDRWRRGGQRKGETEEEGKQISHSINWILLANLNTFSCGGWRVEGGGGRVEGGGGREGRCSLIKSFCLSPKCWGYRYQPLFQWKQDLFIKFLLFYFYLLWLCMCIYNMWLHTCHWRVCRSLRTTSGNLSCPSTVGSRDLWGKWFLPTETF